MRGKTHIFGRGGKGRKGFMPHPHPNPLPEGEGIFDSLPFKGRVGVGMGQGIAVHSSARLFQSASGVVCGLKKALIAVMAIMIVPLSSWGDTQSGTVISNTATANYLAGTASLAPARTLQRMTSDSNRLDLVVVPVPTTATIEIMKYAPSYSNSESVTVSTTEYSPSGNSSDSFISLPSPTPLGASSPLDLSRPIPLAGTDVFQEHDVLFIRVTDRDNNRDSAKAETILVTMTVPTTDETELLRLYETGQDTGVFTGYISVDKSSAQVYNGVINFVAQGYSVTASYTDAYDSSDAVSDSTLVDPYGLVFDSTNGNLVDGAKVTLINATTGQPATVYGDDGVSAFPSTVISGSTATDSSGTVYTFPPGEYRFPYILDGQYRLEITPPTGYQAPSDVSADTLQTLAGAPYTLDESGSWGKTFNVQLGPAVKIDIPVDPVYAWLYVTKTASKDTASIGDFLQYKISVENTSEDYEVENVVVSDRLPLGFRYRKGSTKVGGVSAPDPAISNDGRTLSFSIGALAAQGSTEITYVVEIAAGAKIGDAANSASASGTTTVTRVKVSSNTAKAVVKVKDDFFTETSFIMGRVAIGCDDDDTGSVGAGLKPAPTITGKMPVPPNGGNGVEGIRIYLEDGTYVVTDKKGMYHFTGVKPGAHVVQLDTSTVPEGYELKVCEENSRFAGNAYSQFVDLQGGTMWRVDFYVVQKPKAPPIEIKGSVGIELGSVLKSSEFRVQSSEGGDDPAGHPNIDYELSIHVGEAPVNNLRVSVILPEGILYKQGSSSLGDAALPDPEIMENVLTYRINEEKAGWEGKVRFSGSMSRSGKDGDLTTNAILTFDSPAAKNLRTPMAENILRRKTAEERKANPDTILHPHFDVIRAELKKEDLDVLDGVISELKKVSIVKMYVTGHTDSTRIAPRSRQIFADNYALSTARAKSVADYIAKGLGLPPEQVIIGGKGPDEPISSNKTAEGRALNRRVELKVISEEVIKLPELKNEKDKSGLKEVETKAVKDLEISTAEKEKEERIKAGTMDMPEIDNAWLDKAEPGLAWVWPGEDFNPPISRAKILIKHDPMKKLKILVNGKEVEPIFLDGTMKRGDGRLAVSFWIGIHLVEGDNLFDVFEYEEDGPFSAHIKRIIHYSGSPVKAEFVPERSRLTADGKTPPVIAVRLTDKDGRPAREGVIGEYTVAPPYQSLQKVEDLQKSPIVTSSDNLQKYVVAEDGMAFIELQPTTKTGDVSIRFRFAHGEEEAHAWLSPEYRDWILVGLAEGTVGYNTVSGNMESLGDSDIDDKLYKDGRAAFFAKGRVKGKWLLTVAYDGNKSWKQESGSLNGAINPEKYYTLYGDATEQKYESASARALYVKIERDRFYAMFGDFQTGMTVTELSKYSRSLNGFKSEMKEDRYDFNVFAADTEQAFVKDEIRGDGTSGLYRLSKKNIVMNSETVVIETRDRYRSENILSTETMTRYTDYNIDYEEGTLYFKSPVASTDEDFNPIYIVVNYESFDSSNRSLSYGGRGAVRLLDKKLDVGATYIHEGRGEENGDLIGADATYRLSDKTRLTAEYAATKTDFTGEGSIGSAYLAEVSHKSKTAEGKAYFREQTEEFGLGQQNGSESGSRKFGFDASYRITDSVTLNGDAYRQYDLSEDTRKDMAELKAKYAEKNYELYTGLRHAEDTASDGSMTASEQLIAGARYNMLNDRLVLRMEHDQSVGQNGSADYPTRTTIGADYKLSETATAFASQEFSWGGDADSSKTSIGLKASPWNGGQISSSIGQDATENGSRVFSSAGLKQAWKINKKWSVDGGMDRSETLRQEGDSDSTTQDFTALSLGAAYKEEKWSWTGRAEKRDSEDEDKIGISTGVYGEPKDGIGMSLKLQAFKTDSSSGRKLDSDLRLGLAYRPEKSRWIVLDRLDYIIEEQRDSDSNYDNWRLVNNLNANYKMDRKTQLSLQYGAKYVRETIDDNDYSGYTDLMGVEGRYDVTKKWDIGLRGNILHSWDVDQYKYGYGPSVGYNFVKNVWLSLGYNFEGFRDRDFSRADFTAEGPYVKFRVKFDQGTAKDAVKWFTGQ